MKHEHRFSTFCHDVGNQALAVFGANTLSEAIVAANCLVDVDPGHEFEVFIVDFETGRTVRLSDALIAQAA
jgi:hypothetical protein